MKTQEATGIDFVNNPDLLAQEANAMISALWFWNKKKLNQFADLDDIKTITPQLVDIRNNPAIIIKLS